MNRDGTIRIDINAINRILCVIYLFNVVFFPVDNFNLKILSLLLLLLLNVSKIFRGFNDKSWSLLFFGCILPSVTIVWSIILTGDLSNIRLGYMGYILLLYPIIKNPQLKFYDIFLKILDLLSLYIVVSAFLDVSGILSLYNNSLLMWFYESENAMIGKGEHLPLYIMLFFKTSPLLFIALVDRLQKKRYLMGCVIVIAIFFSGTRANILCLAGVICVYFVFLCKNKKFRLISSFAVSVLVMYILIDGSVIEFVLDVFARKASGDQVRNGHLKGILEYFSENPIKFLVGSGFSSKFYSYGVKGLVSNIELSYWNLLRQVGLLLFIPMMYMFLCPLLRMWKKKTDWAIAMAYAVYLLIAYTNPLLYSSTGVTLLLVMYDVTMNDRNSNNASSYQEQIWRNEYTSYNERIRL